MRMVDLIEKKRDGGVLSDEEIRFIIDGFTKGEIPDYQMSAWAMAVFYKGMTDHETAVLTDAMMRSGDTIDLSRFGTKSVDKHSTGGVGDKTTLVIAPIVAACGVKIAKMSGRGLGHTGGTIDKMESVPGTRTSLTQEEFFKQVNEIGISVIGQSGKIAVADKKMYALRDVTATVGCIPLIASSIMSKKLAAGSDAILLDVTMGDGAFMKDLDGALELARQIIRDDDIVDNLFRKVRGEILESIRDGSYPIADSFFAITAAPIGAPDPRESNPNLNAFLDWILSEQGQQFVEDSGYVSIR